MEVKSYVVGLIATIFLIVLLKTQFFYRLLHWITSLKSYKRLYALRYKSWQEYPNPSRNIREKLLVQAMEKLAQTGGDLLELGAANGKNLEFMRLPAGSSIIAVDYNPNMEAYFRENMNNFPNNNIQLKKYVVEDAANMKSIEDNSIALVLGTQLHCSLEEESVGKAMSEIKRVLKPGGSYFFLEHVLDEPGTLRRFFQILAYSVEILPLIAGGCRCNKETWKYLYEAGFSEISYQRCYGDYCFYWSAPFLSLLYYMSRPKIFGFAVKL